MSAPNLRHMATEERIARLEAAVEGRGEVAVDREALAAAIQKGMSQHIVHRPRPSDLADAVLDSGILRNAAAVRAHERHKHAERIADHFEYMEVGGHFSHEQVADKIRHLWDDAGPFAEPEVP